MEEITEQWCVDMDQLHMSGVSNGGMFIYYLATSVTDGMGFASFNPVAASPLLGFGIPPKNVDINFSILDMHGLIDDTIPYSLETSEGVGPNATIISWDGYYYE